MHIYFLVHRVYVDRTAQWRNRQNANRKNNEEKSQFKKKRYSKRSNNKFEVKVFASVTATRHKYSEINFRSNFDSQLVEICQNMEKKFDFYFVSVRNLKRGHVMNNWI